MQLEVDADPMAPYLALPAVYIRSSPFSFSFIPSKVYRIFVIYLTDFIVLLISIPFIFFGLSFTSISFPITKQKRTAAQFFDDTEMHCQGLACNDFSIG